MVNSHLIPKVLKIVIVIVSYNPLYASPVEDRTSLKDQGFAEPHFELLLSDISELLIYDIEQDIYDLSKALGWEGHSFRAKRIVDTIQFVGVKLLQAGHDALGLEGPSLWWGRLLYWLSAGHLDARLQLVTPTIFGHEMTHLQESHVAGVPVFYLVRNLEPIVFYQGYVELILNFSPKFLVAAAALGRGKVYNNIGHASNFSTWIGAERAADLAWHSQSIFGFSGYMLNSMAASGYAVADLIIPGAMDIDIFAADLSQRSGRKVSTAQISVVSLLASLLSPTFWSYIYGMVLYIGQGETRVRMLGFSRDSLFISWDMPAYFNDDSVSLRPLLYTRLNDNFLLGTGFEFGILGLPEIDILLDLRFMLKGIEISVKSALAITEIFVGELSFFFYPSIRYDLGKIFFKKGLQSNWALNVSALFTVGKTLRGERLNPYRKPLYQVSISAVF